MSKFKGIFEDAPAEEQQIEAPEPIAEAREQPPQMTVLPP